MKQSFHPSPFKLMNLKVTEFFSDMDSILGELVDYNLFKKSLALMASFDERAIQRSFDKYVCIPFSQYIVQRNESFFLTTDSTLDSKIAADNNIQDFDLINIIKTKWVNLSVADKDAIWGHLQLLVILNAQCIASVRARN